MTDDTDELDENAGIYRETDEESDEDTEAVIDSDEPVATLDDGTGADDGETEDGD